MKDGGEIVVVDVELVNWISVTVTVLLFVWEALMLGVMKVVVLVTPNCSVQARCV